MEQGRNQSLRLPGGSKLIPRDISESLGKLPPQALDLEESVLGALMIETRAIEKVKFLKPDHFYDDRHREVFRAINFLHNTNINPDFRMVINRLREAGKIELVGGHYFVVELTTKAQSAENIESHARVIVEHSLKRSLIEIASHIHHDAYEDTTDVFHLLEHVQQDIKFLEERETANTGPERIKALWEKFRIITKPERPETLIKFGDADVCTVGNISLLVGKKKSRKSLLVTLMLDIFLKSRMNVADDLVVFDTEQEEYDVWMAMDRLYRMTNQHIPIFCLRGLSPKERRDFIEQTVTHWHRPLKIGVIDGIRDCMSNINDPDESTEVMTWLMRMNVQTKIHFINILHLNKTDNNARGHIGSELLNKAEITIEVELDSKSKELYPPSIVRCESARRKPFEMFMMTHGPTGLPEIIGSVVGHDTVDQEEKMRRLLAVFDGETLRNKEVRQEICAHFGVGDNKARKLLAEFIRAGWIMKSGGDRSPNTVYKINIQSLEPKITVLPEVQQEIFNTPPTVNTDDLPF